MDESKKDAAWAVEAKNPTLQMAAEGVEGECANM